MKKISIIFLASFILTGCSLWKGVGENLGEGIFESLEDRDSLFSSIGGNITKGARDSIINKETEEKLNHLITELLVTTKREAALLIDSIMGEYLQKRLREISGTARTQTSLLRDDLLGDETRVRLALIRNELIGDTALSSFTRMRNELLGANTSILLDSLIGGAINAVLVGYENISPKIREDLRAEGTFIQNNASVLLWTAGAIIAILIIVGGIVYFKSQKYKEMSELLTYQIHKIPDQKSYDELTSRIKNQAQEKAIEPDLRKLLTDQGIAYDTNWRK